MRDQSLAIILYSVIAITAAVLCFRLYSDATEINRVFTSYTDEDLNVVEYLSGIQSYFSENERLLYEYYAFVKSRTDTQIRIALVRSKLSEILEHLYSRFSNTREYQVLIEVFHEFDAQLKSLETILNTGNAAPGQAHEQLASLSMYGEHLTPVLEQLLDLARNDAFSKQAFVSAQLNQIVTYTSVFTVVSLLFFLIIGMSIRSMLKVDAARKKLAYFPERSPIAVYSLDFNGKIVFANPASHRMSAVIDPELSHLLPENIIDIILDLQSSGKASIVHEYTLHGHILSATLQLVTDYKQCHVYISDITSQVKAEKELKQLAFYDPVTGLPNTSCFIKDADDFIENENTRFSALLFSFVRFDLITRSADNKVIDALLRRASEQVLSNLHEMKSCRYARLYRLSGVSFMILLKAEDDSLLEQTTSRFAEYIQTVFASPLVVKRREFYLSPAISSCVCPDDAITTDTLLANTHTAMEYLIKENKSGYQPFNQAIRMREQEWLKTETAMRKGIENHEFLLYYQPKLSGPQKELSGMEALVRWQHGGQLVPPDRFIPVAEESGLIIPLGDWILNEACRQAAEWLNNGITEFSIAVNISAIQLYQPDFSEKVEQTLSRHDLPARYLELELTESVLMRDIDTNLKTLNYLKDLGIALSLDDFGTGYSSLAYLRQLPISKLKIDRGFIANIQNAGTDRGMVRTMIEMAHMLGLKTVAEGVETEEQETLLRQLDCDEFQGYYYSKPVIAAEMNKWWKTASVTGIQRVQAGLNISRNH